MKLFKLLGIGFICFCFGVNNSFAQEIVLDEVIAVVGKNMIKLSELETAYIQSKYKAGIIEQEFKTKCGILEGMLINKLMLDQAALDSVVVTDDQINREMDNRVRYLIRGYGSKENLEKQMGKTIGEIKDFYKDLIKENLMISEIESKLTGNVKITPKEVTDYYNSIPVDSLPVVEDEYEFSQIVKLPVVSDEEKLIVKEKLNGYRDRILKGDKFSTLATLYSEDPGSSKKGGELGFFSRGDMVSEFEAVAFTLQPGEISPVFESKYGFHIVQLIERRGDQVNCRHILIQPKVSEKELYKAKLSLDSIKELIVSGVITFEDAIKKYSDDASKLNRGLIINPYSSGTKFQKEGLNEVLENLDKFDCTTMQEGDLSEPILFKTELGAAYRLIKLTSKSPSHKVNLKDDYDKIYSSVLESTKTNVLMNWANKKVSKTYVKINQDYKDCDFKIKWNFN